MPKVGPIGADAERSLARSRQRARVLVMLCTPLGRVFRITERGRRKARSVMAASRRFGRKIDRL